MHGKDHHRARWQRWVAAAMRFGVARVSPGTYLGLHFTLGVVAIAVGMWLFIEVADAVHERDDIAAFDGAVAEWLHRNAAEPVTVAVRVLTWLGDPILVVGVALVAGALWWRARRFGRAALVWGATLGGMLMNTALKYVFSRERPEWENPLGEAHGFSFPSGHVAGATLLYGTLGLIAVRRARTWRGRALAVVVPALVIELVAFTRLYLGVHYLTDVLAAQAAALAWVALCVTAVDTLRRRQRWLAERDA